MIQSSLEIWAIICIFGIRKVSSELRAFILLVQIVQAINAFQIACKWFQITTVALLKVHLVRNLVKSTDTLLVITNSFVQVPSGEFLFFVAIAVALDILVMEQRHDRGNWTGIVVTAYEKWDLFFFL